MLRRKGSLLIFAIWVLVLFAVLSAALYRIISAQINVAKALEERLISQYLAKAAYAYAQRQILLDDTAYDSLCELGKEEEIELGQGKAVYRIADEQGKININAKSAAKDGEKKELLTKIFSRLPGIEEGVDREDIGKAIVAYSTSTEKKDRYFQVKEEILLIEEITEEKFNRFKDYITVYGSGEVNINTASEEVLTILLGIDEEDDIDEIKDYRTGPDGEEGTEDDTPFETEANITGGAGLGSDVANVLVGKQLLGVSSDTYCLEVNTTVFNRPAMRYNIVFDKEGIKRWQEY